MNILKVPLLKIEFCFPSRQGRGLRGLSASLKAMSSDNSKVLLTPRLARRLAAVSSTTSTPGESRSPSESPSKEPLSGESRREEKEGNGDREGLQVPSEQNLPPCTPPTRSPSISASSSSSSSSSPALEPAGELRREPMNIYNLNAIIRDQVEHSFHFSISGILFLLSSLFSLRIALCFLFLPSIFLLSFLMHSSLPLFIFSLHNHTLRKVWSVFSCFFSSALFLLYFLSVNLSSILLPPFDLIFFFSTFTSFLTSFLLSFSLKHLEN